MGALKSLAFKNCSWLGDIGPNRPPWCPALDGLTSLTELVFDHCPMLNTLPDAVCTANSRHACLFSQFCCYADRLQATPWCGLHQSWLLYAEGRAKSAKADSSCRDLLQIGCVHVL